MQAPEKVINAASTWAFRINFSGCERRRTRSWVSTRRRNGGCSRAPAALLRITVSQADVRGRARHDGHLAKCGGARVPRLWRPSARGELDHRVLVLLLDEHWLQPRQRARPRGYPLRKGLHHLLLLVRECGHRRRARTPQPDHFRPSDVAAAGGEAARQVPHAASFERRLRRLSPRRSRHCTLRRRPEVAVGLHPLRGAKSAHSPFRPPSSVSNRRSPTRRRAGSSSATNPSSIGSGRAFR